MNKHTLYFNRLTAQQVFQFLSATQGILFNVVWHLPASFTEESTQNVYCELNGNDLAGARQQLTQVAHSAGLPPDSWTLTPDLI
nr:hypothetical protein [uncultured Janthinobacterium sp.]